MINTFKKTVINKKYTLYAFEIGHTNNRYFFAHLRSMVFLVLTIQE